MATYHIIDGKKVLVRKGNWSGKQDQQLPEDNEWWSKKAEIPNDETVNDEVESDGC